MKKKKGENCHFLISTLYKATVIKMVGGWHRRETVIGDTAPSPGVNSSHPASWLSRRVQAHLTERTVGKWAGGWAATGEDGPALTFRHTQMNSKWITDPSATIQL